MGRTNPTPNHARHAGTRETASGKENNITLSDLQAKPVLWYKVSNISLFQFSNHLIAGLLYRTLEY